MAEADDGISRVSVTKENSRKSGGEKKVKRMSVLQAGGAATSLALDKIKSRMSTINPFGGSRDPDKPPPPPPMLTPWLVEEFGDAFAVSNSGTVLTHMRKGFDIAVGDLTVNKGSGVHKVGFKVVKSRNGKGHNIYIGVTDAAATRKHPSPDDGGGSKTQRGGQTARNGAPFKHNSGSMGKAWGLHPFDGTVYYSDDGFQRGEKAWLPRAKDAAGLTVQQVAQLQHEHARGKADGWVVEVILDMNNLKLSFAVNGGTAIDARVDLPESVCPYVFFDWKEDAVEITHGCETQLRQALVCKDPGAPDKVAATPRKQSVLKSFAKGSSAPTAAVDMSGPSPAAGTAAAVTPSSPSRALSGSSSAEANLQRALTVLLRVHSQDASVLAMAVPDWKADAGTSRAKLLAEIERLGGQIDTLSEDIYA